MGDFVHLHNHTGYSLLDGAGRVADMVRRAKELGMDAVAMTDHGNMYGAVEFYREATKCGIKPIIGCETYIAPRSRLEKKAGEGESYYHLVLLATNQTGYSNLVELVSLGYSEGFYYKPRIDKELLRKHHEGLIALSACIAGEIPSLLLAGDSEGAEAAALEYIDIFGPDNFFIELQDHGMPEQQQVNPALVELAAKLGIGLVATNDVHYIDKQDAAKHDILLCIQTLKTVDDTARMRFPSDEFYLKNTEDMAALFRAYPEAIRNSCLIAERCQFDFKFDELHLPDFPVPDGTTADEYLRMVCAEGLAKRYPDVDETIKARFEYELGVILSMGFASYFLIVWDFIRYAREKNIPVGPGRGSAAGSIVSYALGITNIDPLKYGLLFERFLNPERVTMPDIDIDLCYVRRSEVIEYVSARYGADRVAQIITFGTLGARGGLKDVGRALNVPLSEVVRIAKLVPEGPNVNLKDVLATSKEFRSMYEAEEMARKIIDTAIALEGLPRNSSTHAAGLVIAKEALACQVPLQNTADGFITTQYDKDCIEKIGFLKMDLLGLRTLTVISDTLALVRENRGITVDIDLIPLEDPVTCQALARGETLGIFQMESSGMTSLVRDLKPDRFEDLIPLVALYRPGPLGSGMVEDFIQGRHARKETSYLHPSLEPILKDTFGVILYQEQIMQIANVMGGFNLGQADLLRRAISKKLPEVLAAQRERFLKGTGERGIDPAIANEVFDLIQKFADYGFNKSHSAAYAMVAYQTAYLKANYPEEFMGALLTSVMGRSDKIGKYIEECRRLGIKMLPPDINRSQLNFSVEGQGLRFGLAGVKNVGEGAIENIIEIRKEEPFKSIVDFCSRVDMRLVNKRVVESLVKAGAFDATGWKRSQLIATIDRAIDLAVARKREKANGQTGLFGDEQMDSLDELNPPKLDELPAAQILAMEKEMTGFFVTGHPLDPFRERLKSFTAIDDVLSPDFGDNRPVKIAGIISSSKRVTTRNNDIMCFLNVEDFTGVIEVVVFPRVYEKYHPIMIPDKPVQISGRSSSGDETMKVMADSMEILEKAPDKAPREVRILIRGDQENPEIFEALKEIFVKHRGQTTVYLNLAEKKRLIKTDAKYWIEPTAVAVADIEAVLGEGSASLA